MTTDPRPEQNDPEQTDPESTAAQPAPTAPQSPAPTHNEPRRSRSSKSVPLMIGVGVLGLLVGAGAGVGITLATRSTPATSSTAKLTLPSTLSGGYKRNTTIDAQIKTPLASAETTLGAGTDMAVYTVGTNQVLVEATRIGIGPALSAGLTYAKVGDATCASSASANGSEAICTRGNKTLTVQVTATDQATAAKYLDEVYKSVA